jgi:hypothetical protein
MKKLPTIEISELFLVKADWNRTFVGQIIRKTDEDGLSINLGNVTVNEGKIWSKAETQEELGNNLDDICTLKLDHNLHNSCGVTSILAETLFNHN